MIAWLVVSKPAAIITDISAFSWWSSRGLPVAGTMADSRWAAHGVNSGNQGTSQLRRLASAPLSEPTQIKLSEAQKMRS